MKKIISILGAIYSINAFAYYTETIPNRCGAINSLLAVFTLNEYTCASGEFLPAHSLGCESCPADYTCNGGTYGFNDNEYQGATQSNDYITHNLTNMCATNVPHALVATFTPNTHTCVAGYYLPANVDGCTKCPANSYCPGGTFSFNETAPQGITACSTGLYAPPGMWEGAQCGRVLHIGDAMVYLRSTKQTTPALNVDTDGDGLPDFFANATTADVAMNAATVRKLKMSYGGVTYSIYDDTIQINE